MGSVHSLQGYHRSRGNQAYGDVLCYRMNAAYGPLIKWGNVFSTPEPT